MTSAEASKYLRTSPPGLPQRYVTVLLTFLCTCVCYVERVGFSIAYTSTAQKLGVHQATKGWVLSAFYYGYASSQVPGGWAAQKLGGRRVLLLSFVLWSITCLLTPTDPKVPIYFLIAIRLSVGVAQGFIFPSIHTVLAQWIPPHERSRSVSLTTSGMYFGAAVAMLFLPTLVANRGPGSVFQLVAGMGVAWAVLWMRYSTDPPGGVAGFPPERERERERIRGGGVGGGGGGASHGLLVEENGEGGVGGGRDVVLGVKKLDLVDVGVGGGGVGVTITGSGSKGRKMAKEQSIPWVKIMMSWPVWAIVVNNFTFHYALYVLMNWLPTYFDQGLHASLHNMGISKMLPYFVMFLFSNIGGIIADHLITQRIFSVTSTRKILNTLGFLSAAAALLMMPVLRSVTGAVLCSSVALGSCALARAGFAVNHLDIAPRYAGIVMGVSNTAGTVAGVVGVAATGLILEAANEGSADMEGWRMVFATPAVLCVLSAIVFCLFATGERIFD